MSATSAACLPVSGLSFCNQVNYAVPGPAGNSSNSSLGNAYDEIARTYYQSFMRLLNQYDCDTHYSYERNCKDCEKAYKDWLCAVTIPRCTNATNIVSENLVERSGATVRGINGTTGRWTEVMPCVGLCYRVIQSCPSFFDFHCPEEMRSRNASYGVWIEDQPKDAPGQCNTMGVDMNIRGVPSVRLATSSATASHRSHRAAAGSWIANILIWMVIILIVSGC